MQIETFKKTRLKNLTHKSNLLEFNREIKSGHVAKMATSVDKCGILRLPVIGDVSAFENKRTHVIVDGQHLLTALVNHDKIPTKGVQCLVKKYESKAELIKDVATLNNTMKTWNDNDFLEAWYKYGRDNKHYPQYAYLRGELHNLGITIGVILQCYVSNKSGITAFRSGRFEIKDQEKGAWLSSMAYKLKEKKVTAAGQTGFVIWARKQKDLDRNKIESRLFRAIKNKEDRHISNRNEYQDFCERIYTRV